MKKLFILVLMLMGTGFFAHSVSAVNLADYRCHGSGCPKEEVSTPIASPLLNCQKYGYGCVWSNQPFEREELTKEQYIIKREKYQLEVEARFMAEKAKPEAVTKTETKIETKIENGKDIFSGYYETVQPTTQQEIISEPVIEKLTWWQKVNRFFKRTFSKKFRNMERGFVIVKTFDCPTDHPIKANIKSGIYHTRQSQYYSRTSARNSECFDTEVHAREQGYRAPFE